MDRLIEEFLPIAGGDGEGDPPSGGGPPQETSSDSPQDSSWKEGDPLDKHPRFNEVIGERNKARESLEGYQRFGSTEELQSRMDRLDEYDEAIKKHREKQSMTQDEQDQDANNARIRKQMLNIMPELKKLETMDEGQFDSRYVSREEQNWERASTYFGSFLKAKNINVDQATQDDIEDFVLTKMSDQEKRAIASGDLSGIEGIYARVSERPFFKGLSGSSQNGDQSPPGQEKVPKRVKPGGTAPKPEGEKAKTWKDAEDRAWAKMKESFPGG